DLAFDLSLAALLGENVYNFGELLAHPIFKSLLGTKVEWLYRLIEAFNSGDISRYEEIRRTHGAALNTQLALVGNEKRILEKINILSLMEIIFRRLEIEQSQTWVEPRVLGITQIKSLRDRVGHWVDKVHTALQNVEAETPDLVAP
ncbi:hypothetical protein M569_07759, partial [Genlisea aurea]